MRAKGFNLPEGLEEAEGVLTPELLRANGHLRRAYEEYLECQKELARRECLRSPLYLAREVLGYKDMLDEHEPYQDIVGMMLRHDEVGKPFNLFLIPRDCLKTTLITITHSIWLLINCPNIRILITNAVLDNAKKMMHEIKMHISSNPKFIELFGNLKGGVWREDEITISTRTINAKEMTIEIGSPGNTKTSKHYDYIKADDLVTRENIKSPESKEEIYKYFQDLLDLLDHPGGFIDVVGTRWDYGDLYSFILDPERPHTEDFEVYLKGAMNEQGDYVFPWKLNKKTLDMLKRNKSALEFSAQYMNDPVPSSDATFKEDYFKRKYRPEELPKLYRRYFLVDPAASKNKRTDFSTGVVLDVSEKNEWFIRDMFRDRLLPGALEKKIFKFSKQWKPDQVAIETVAFQLYIKKSLYKTMKENNEYFNVAELEPHGRNKDDRIRALEPKFANGEVFFPADGIKYITQEGKEQDMVFALKDELIKFPNSTKRDLGDVVAYGLDICRSPRKAVEKEEQFHGTGTLQYLEFKERQRMNKLEKKEKEVKIKETYEWEEDYV